MSSFDTCRDKDPSVIPPVSLAERIKATAKKAGCLVALAVTIPASAYATVEVVDQLTDYPPFSRDNPQQEINWHQSQAMDVLSVGSQVTLGSNEFDLNQFTISE